MSSPPTTPLPTSQKKSTFRSRVGGVMRRSSTAFSIPVLPNRSATPPPPQDFSAAFGLGELSREGSTTIDTAPVAAAASTTPSPIPESPAREADALAAAPEPSPLANVITAEAALDQSPTSLRSGTPPPPEPAAATAAPRSISPGEQPTKTTPAGVVNEAESPGREVALLPTDEPEEMPTTQVAPPTRLDGDPDEREDSAFLSLQSSLSLQVFKINSNVQGILKLVDQLGTTKDSASLRKSLHDLTDTTRAMAKRGSEDLKKLASMPASSPHHKTSLQKTSHDLQLCLVAFQRTLQISAERQRTIVEGVKIVVEDEEPRLFEHSSPQQRHAQLLRSQLSPHELAYQESLLQEREAEIQEIEIGIQEIETGIHELSPGSPEDTYIDTHSQGPKDDDEGKNVEEKDEPPSELSWLRDVLKSSAVAPLGGTNEASDPLGASFLKNVLPTSDAPPPVDEVRKKRFAKFRDIFARNRKDVEAETQVQEPSKRPFKFRTMLIRKKKDEQTQPRPDHQQVVEGAGAGGDAQPETTSRELTAKDKGKQRETDPNPAPAGHISRASTRSTTHQPTSASRTKHRVHDGVAGIMRRRNGSTAQAQNRLESAPRAEGNSTERDAAEPSRVRKDSSNRRPWFRRMRDPEVVEVMEGHMPDRYVSGHKFAQKRRSSSVESGSGSDDTEDRAEDSGEDEPEEEPTRNKTPGGLIGMLCFCSCIP